MRSTLWFCLILLTFVVWTGCTNSNDPPQPEMSSPKNAPNPWASDNKPPASQTPPPTTGNDKANETTDSPSGQTVPPADTSDDHSEADKTDNSATEPNPAPLQPSQVPEDVFNVEPANEPTSPTPAETPESPPTAPNDTTNEPSGETALPPLHNPLRDQEPPSANDSTNPIRGPAPMPGTQTNNEATTNTTEPTNGSESTLPVPTPTASELQPNGGAGDLSTPETNKVSPENNVPNANSKLTKTNESGEEPFDPIKENGPIFVGWPKPRLAIVLTGRADGYIEPCGCAGLEKMKGGLSRRHTMLRELDAKGWPLVVVDTGGLIKTYGRQTEIKFQITVEAMRKMGYGAIGFGLHDLQLPAAELVSVAADPSPSDPSPFVSSNIGLLGFDAGLTSKTKIIDAGGLKVGVTSVLGKKFQSEINNSQIEMIPPEEALKQVIPELRKKCNLLILLAYATKEESIELGKKFPDFQLVVTSGGPAEPPDEPLQIPGTKSLLIEVGEKSANAVVLGLYNDPKKPLRYQRVPLDSRFKASKDMYRLMVAYQEQLKLQGLEGLSIRPVAHPQSDVNGGFVGSEKCKSCHEESYRIWKKSGHAKAWKTLVENDPPRNFDPECISCHVIGWHPTRHFPYKTGFLSFEQTPEMINVGCESCHGPCEAHCKAEDGSDFNEQERQYKAVRITKEEAKNSLTKMCRNCHDLDNSPEFNFETYWPKVEHYEDED